VWEGRWHQVGRSIDKKNVDRNGEEREEGDEGGALQPLSRDKGLGYGEPRRAELGRRLSGGREKLRGVRPRFSEAADPWGWKIECRGSPMHCDWIE